MPQDAPKIGNHSKRGIGKRRLIETVLWRRPAIFEQALVPSKFQKWQILGRTLPKRNRLF